MARYSINLYNVAWEDSASKRKLSFDEALANPYILSHTLATKIRTSFEAEVQVEAEDLRRALRGTGDLLRSKGIHAGFRGWTGWYSADVVRCANRKLNAEYTPGEIAAPDSILATPIPETKTGTQTIGGVEYNTVTPLQDSDIREFIKQLRKRYRTLVRYKLSIQFAEANPNLGFESPRGGVQGGGITKLRLLDGTGVTFSAVRRRVHINGAYVDEWIEATDSHRFQALTQFNQHAVAHSQPQPGNPAILHDIEQEALASTPELLHQQQVHSAWVAAQEVYLQSAAQAWLDNHPEPPGAITDEDLPF